MGKKTDDDLIRELWAEGKGKSLRAIGKQLSCSHVAIFKRLKRMGLDGNPAKPLSEEIGSHTPKGSAQVGNHESCERCTRARVTEKKPPYLVKDGTDEIFGYTPFLAERADMKPFFGTLEQFKEGRQKKRKFLNETES